MEEEGAAMGGEGPEVAGPQARGRSGVQLSKPRAEPGAALPAGGWGERWPPRGRGGGAASPGGPAAAEGEGCHFTAAFPIPLCPGSAA